MERLRRTRWIAILFFIASISFLSMNNMDSRNNFPAPEDCDELCDLSYCMEAGTGPPAQVCLQWYLECINDCREEGDENPRRY